MEINKFGNYLRFKRKQLNFTLKDVENKTGISASYINRLEVGNRQNPTCWVVRKLCNFYNIPENIFFTTSDEINFINKVDNSLIHDEEINILLKCILTRISKIADDNAKKRR